MPETSLRQEFIHRRGARVTASKRAIEAQSGSLNFRYVSTPVTVYFHIFDWTEILLHGCSIFFYRGSGETSCRHSARVVSSCDQNCPCDSWGCSCFLQAGRICYRAIERQYSRGCYAVQASLEGGCQTLFSLPSVGINPRCLKETVAQLRLVPGVLLAGRFLEMLMTLLRPGFKHSWRGFFVCWDANCISSSRALLRMCTILMPSGISGRTSHGAISWRTLRFMRTANSILFLIPRCALIPRVFVCCTDRHTTPRAVCAVSEHTSFRSRRPCSNGVSLH